MDRKKNKVSGSGIGSFFGTVNFGLNILEIEIKVIWRVGCKNLVAMPCQKREVKSMGKIKPTQGIYAVVKDIGDCRITLGILEGKR